MERETETITTPIGKQKVVIKKWLTGRERRDIINALVNETTFDSQNVNNFKLKGEILSKSQDAAIKAIIVDIDGKSEDILDIVLDMRSEDYDFIIKEIDKISGATQEIKKE